MLRVDLVDFEGNIKYAEYTDFNVTDEADKYWLFVEGYKGTAGDSMLKGIMSSKRVSISSRGRHVSIRGAVFERYNGVLWRYKSCHQSHLNRLCLNCSHVSNADGVNWPSFRGHRCSLKRTEMKVKNQ
ncbi:unnamed protein product, partial [Pocillopora meandrina]